MSDRPESSTPEAGAEEAPADLTGTSAHGPDGRDARTPTTQDGAAAYLQRIARSESLTVVLAFLFAILIVSVLIVVVDPRVQAAAGYFVDRPGDTFAAIGTALGGAYAAMFNGAVLDVRQDSLVEVLRPLTETLTVATPLIIAALGIAVALRAGLFNIGGQGQIIAGAVAAGWIGFAVPLPPVLHLVVALVAGIGGGMLWGGISGFLKARFGSHEVITTIMLNWIAVYLLAFLLTTTAFTGANQFQPTSPAVSASAQLPLLLGPNFRLHLGLVLALAAAWFMWWLMNRSTLGFAFRAVGANPSASRTAGISVGRAAFLCMVVAGGLVGLGGAVHVLGTQHRVTDGIAGNIGFDALTVALLGRSGPVGIVLAGILFAGLSVGGGLLQANQGLPVDITQIVQSLVVLFIAAPPLVHTLFRPIYALLERPGRTAEGSRA